MSENIPELKQDQYRQGIRQQEVLEHQDRESLASEKDVNDLQNAAYC